MTACPTSDAKAARLIAFYLPQYHPIPENDAWWGRGFTEWTNVVQARPQFDGHPQPQLPADLGFYDLRLEATRAAQAALARAYGIDAFCYYYYWFGGKRLLEQPLEAMLAGQAPDLPFCLCWANENWTRRWNGAEQDVLMAQRHSPEDDRAVMADLARYFADSRYLRIDGRPLLLLYRCDILPDPAATVRRWREVCATLDVGDPYLCAVQSFGIEDPTRWGFDAAVMFPPHGLVAAEVARQQTGLSPGFRGRIFSYPDAMRAALAKSARYPRFPGVMPAWDNTARKREAGHVYIGSHPLRYRAWLAEAIRTAEADPLLPVPLVFINAWNEWGEGCHLEPDLRDGHAWLQATRAAREQGPAPQVLLDGLVAGRTPVPGTAPDAPWSAVQMDAGEMCDTRLSPGWRGRGFARLRVWVNRYPGLKRRLRPIARMLGWVD
jgi:lipopolysaccharide biosynthesis protein